MALLSVSHHNRRCVTREFLAGQRYASNHVSVDGACQCAGDSWSDPQWDDSVPEVCRPLNQTAGFLRELALPSTQPV